VTAESVCGFGARHAPGFLDAYVFDPAKAKVISAGAKRYTQNS
jgi:hypothetical protein